MADPTTPPSSPDNPDTKAAKADAPKADAPKADAKAVKAAKADVPKDDSVELRLAELKNKLAATERERDEVLDKSSKDVSELRARAERLEDKVGELLEQMKLAVTLATQRQGEETAEAQKAADVSPARALGQLVVDDRMTEAQILAQVRALRAGKLAPETASRFLTDARIWPDRDTPLAKKYPGNTIPLRTEVLRADFSEESLKHHIASRALIPIA